MTETVTSTISGCQASDCIPFVSASYFSFLNYVISMNWAADKKKYINYLISYIIRPKVCGKQPLVEAHMLSWPLRCCLLFS